MCVTCGCSDPKLNREQERAARVRLRKPHGAARMLQLERSLLEKNQRLAEQNRTWLAERSVVAFNLMGSPGAGKTALLEAVARFAPELGALVVEGDQATERDAERIRRAGCRAIQINTGTGCHLDAHSVLHALTELAPEPGSRVFLENVGNLVCPALFDLGEGVRIVVLSVTEGDDKPLKYPHMFRACDALVLNKIDLLPHVQFEPAQAFERARALNPQVRTFELSATGGQGVESFCAWLRAFGSESAPRVPQHARAGAPP